MRTEQVGVMKQRDREAREEEIGNRCWRDSWELASAQISPEASCHKRVAFLYVFGGNLHCSHW